MNGEVDIKKNLIQCEVSCQSCQAVAHLADGIRWKMNTRVDKYRDLISESIKHYVFVKLLKQLK